MTAVPTTRLHPYNVDIYYATTPKQWRKAHRHYGIKNPGHPNAAGRTDSITHSSDGTLGAVIIWLDPNHRLHDNTAAVIDTLAHEAFHAVACILDAIDEPRDKWHEQTAYLVGWLTAWLWNNTPDDIRHGPQEAA